MFLPPYYYRGVVFCVGKKREAKMHGIHLSFAGCHDGEEGVLLLPRLVLLMCFCGRGGTETGGRGDEGGFWAFEGEDRGCGGEVGGAVGRLLAFLLSVLQTFRS